MLYENTDDLVQALMLHIHTQGMREGRPCHLKLVEVATFGAAKSWKQAEQLSTFGVQCWSCEDRATFLLNSLHFPTRERETIIQRLLTIPTFMLPRLSAWTRLLADEVV